MNERLYRVFHLVGALIASFTWMTCGFMGYMVIRQVSVHDNPDELLLILGLIFTGVSIFRFLVFLFAVFGRYRISVDGTKLSVEVGIGLFGITHQFAISKIEAILVADNGRGRPAIGILADRTFRFGAFLPERSIFDAAIGCRLPPAKASNLQQISPSNRSGQLFQ